MKYYVLQIGFKDQEVVQSLTRPKLRREWINWQITWMRYTCQPQRRFTLKYSLWSIYTCYISSSSCIFLSINLTRTSEIATKAMCTTIHQSYLYCDCFLTKIIYCRKSKTPSRKIKTSKEEIPAAATATPASEKMDAPKQQTCAMVERLSQFPFSCGKEECPRIFTTCRRECWSGERKAEVKAPSGHIGWFLEKEILKDKSRTAARWGNQLTCHGKICTHT
jgi:hypothetical protein